MSYLIAVTGKGGTGKSTLSAALVRQLLEAGIAPVLAVDADPNSTLAPLLGLHGDEYSTLSGIREDLLKEKANSSGIPKERLLEMKMQECIREAPGFDVLTMGRPEGPDCYCYVNNLLRGALTRLRSNYRVTIVDNEAGMEHLSRMNTDAIDCLVTVCEPTRVSARAASRIKVLAATLPITVRRRVLVWNKVNGHGVPDVASRAVAQETFDEVAYVPACDEMAELSVAEQSVFTLPRLEALDTLLARCLNGFMAAAAKL
ncbi:MAG: carbon monoxide dehydrogenase [Candidatus Hydrogenedentes bacterium]|nr:carbon monoxide dehydrogenase [Candidatus Hydrogenedentota bacterium]